MNRRHLPGRRGEVGLTSMRLLLAAVLALLSVASTVVAIATVPLRTHSISMPYIGRFKCLLYLNADEESNRTKDDELQNRWFDFGGSTIINTNRHIRLTNNRQSQQGYLWSRLVMIPIDAITRACIDEN